MQERQSDWVEHGGVGAEIPRVQVHAPVPFEEQHRGARAVVGRQERDCEAQRAAQREHGALEQRQRAQQRRVDVEAVGEQRERDGGAEERAERPPVAQAGEVVAVHVGEKVVRDRGRHPAATRALSEVINGNGCPR